ncbi:MAG: dicarboxylate/amino acid:cation symporter [Saprospiraceae bacterium]|nr:dicarboxylate/amino acid:cation symporter [Saprospiraceae bacterium]MBL0025951.1 dicarboxylate/amino acid:cation symporter [Saprospiraceae bacterium]
MSAPDTEQKKNNLALWIFIGLIGGIVIGTVLNYTSGPEFIEKYVNVAKYGNIIFLKFIKLIIGPLVLSTLVVGVAGIGDAGTIGRMSVKTIGWFIFASLMSLTLGLTIVNIFQPGLDFQNQISEATATNLVTTDTFTLEHFIDQLIPENIFVALSSHKMVLQIVIFSVLFGLALAGIGEKGKPIITAMDSLAHVMLKLTNMIMWIAPLAVFSSISIVIAEKGVGVMVQYGKLILLFYFALLLLWSILIGLGYIFVKKRVWSLLRHIEEPIILAFATASSESAYPKLLNQLERFGVPDKITSFVLPLGYSFNLDGSMMYMTFGSLLIAQAYGINLTLSQQITMLLVLMVTSKGIAAVPRASLVVIAATIAGFGIPEIGIALLLPIDQFLDMGRTATNVVGNAIATVAVSRMEGEEINT